jgi:hypothetical protein
VHQATKRVKELCIIVDTESEELEPTTVHQVFLDEVITLPNLYELVCHRQNAAANAGYVLHQRRRPGMQLSLTLIFD